MSLYLRNKLLELEDRIDADLAAAPEATAATLGKVIDGGSMPSAGGHFYLFQPVSIDGIAREGGAASLVPDAARTFAALVVGSRPVSAGEVHVARSIGGRWVVESGASPPNCEPYAKSCGPSARFAVAGTVEDGLNGIVPIVFDFARRMYFSPWLPFDNSHTLLTGSGSNPCGVGPGRTYYFYSLSLEGAAAVAGLFLPGEDCRLADGAPVRAYYNYSGLAYPSALGRPAGLTVAGTTLVGAGTPSGCDPYTLDASFAGVDIPSTRAKFTIASAVPPTAGETCTLPCPLPREDIHLSWANDTSGPGSAVLRWSAATKDWTTDCLAGLKVRVFAQGSGAVGFVATVSGGSDCSGTQTAYNYPDWLSLASYGCDPLELDFTVLFPSSLLYKRGYRTFAVTR